MLALMKDHICLLFNRRPKIDGAPPKLQIMGQTLLGESNQFKLVLYFKNIFKKILFLFFIFLYYFFDVLY